MKQLFSILITLLFTTNLNLYCRHQAFVSEVGKASSFPERSVVLTDSWVKRREDLNIEYLKSLDPDRLLHNFRVNAGLPSTALPLEGWESPTTGLRGHFTGHYLSAAALVVDKYGDKLLAERLNYMTEELYKCWQRFGNGYLSAFPESDFDVLETRFGGVWAPYYTYQKIMQGLLDVYTRTGNAKAYEMLLGMAGYVEKRMSRLSDDTIEKMLYSVGANPSNEAGAMNEVLYNLYKVSKDPGHLALAALFDRDWFVVPLSKNEDILSGLHANTHIALVNGYAQRYAVTKEKKYRDAVVHFWDRLMESHVYANGTSSGPRPNVTTYTSLLAEHWGVPGQLSNTMTGEIAETCVTHNTQKLSSTLFTWKLDPVYADAYMNTFYNAVMALQSAKTGRCVYHLPLGSPRQKAYLRENDFRCCNGTSIEAFSALNTGVYYRNDTALWVNLYVPSKVHWDEKKLVLEQTGHFPADTCVEFSLTTAKKTDFALKLFIPSWARKAEVYVNGQKQEAKATPNSFISLHRSWKNKDKIQLVFQYDFYLKTMPDDNNVFAIFYGPMLLAFDSNEELIMKGNHESILQQLSKDKESNSFRLNNNGKTYRLVPLFDVEDQSYGVYATIRNY